MQIPKPAEADRERFAGLVPEAPDVEVKPMFGNLGAFVHGNMFMGLFGPDIGVKLPEGAAGAARGAGRRAVRARGAADVGLRDPAGRLGGSQASAWIDRALAYVASLPPKAEGTQAAQAQAAGPLT